MNYLVILVVLAQFPVGIAEDASRGILRQEGQDALLSSAPLGDIVLLHQGVLAMERDRVEIEVEGPPAGQTEPAHGVEPTSHQFRIAGRSDPATVLGQVGSFGDDVQAREEGQPLVQDQAHDVGVACGPEELQGQERPHRTASRNHLRAGETGVLDDSVQGDRSQHRQEEEQAAELGPERRRTQIELPDVGDIGDGRPRPGGTFVIGPTRQASKSFILEDLCHGDRTERIPLMGQVPADVIDGKVLLAQGDDLIAEWIGFGRDLGTFGRGQEEVTSGILAKLMNKNTKASRGVTKAASGLAAGQPLDEESAEGLVLTVGRVGGLEKDLGEIC
jgi:hypothetical protein